MLGDGKGAEGVAGRKHTAHSRTALVNTQDHFLFPVTHCRLGRKRLSREQAVGTAAGLLLAFRNSPNALQRSQELQPPLCKLFPGTGPQLAVKQVTLGWGVGGVQKPEENPKAPPTGTIAFLNTPGLRNKRSFRLRI